MKSVGKQLQVARLAKNWTPELAARETKIKVERVRDLESDNYSNFTSPTYARGFVRTYARALGLDEYRILRQLDNKLPDDDSANLVTDSGIAYRPETTLPPRAAHKDYTGLYVVIGLGAVVMFVITIVLFEAYRAGELAVWFGSSPESVATTATPTTNAAGSPVAPGSDNGARALPVDSNVPPPIVDAPPTNAPTTVADIPGVNPRALPVDLSQLDAPPPTNAAPGGDAVPAHAMRALPVDLTELTNSPTPAPAAPPTSHTATTSGVPIAAPRALPVDPSELTNGTAATAPAGSLIAYNTATPTPAPSPSPAAQKATSGPVMEPSLPAVEPSSVAAPGPPPAPAASPSPVSVPPADPAPAATGDGAADKRLVLTASQDSFVRVTNIDKADAARPLYASVLHRGESVSFDGKKFSINVGVPSAVDIQLDGVNYGPHSDKGEPETFTVESHQPGALPRQ